MKEIKAISEQLANNPLFKEKKADDNRPVVLPSVRHTLPLHTRRSHPRIYRKAYLRFARYRSGYFHEAVMGNESGGGIYFETRHRLTPGTKIYISFDHQTTSSGNNPVNFFTAEVRWCIPVNHSVGVRYGVGVQYHQSILH